MSDHKLHRTDQQMAQQRARPLTMNYGHNGKEIVIQFAYKIDNATLTPKQVDDMIGALQIAKAALVKYQAGEAQQGGAGHG